ncbi:putative peptidoglycan lipid II flippase [Homoserinimonas aerilata]|uniref:Putative peptidoglycan lipid II flippase n=1 Tax=Homoserinimonas aerilata TaxID=1162970 RepID=A0A542YEP2_9MICO|nr:murein biosynthesis integral membrane protein MurJ [Homoserinimonas aerilata]TQL46555.1 putative peptidoglycan lipid II flippase [Homoserinimonas aerilata]
MTRTGAATPSPGLGRSSALLASGTVVSRVLGFIKAIVLAQTIGQTASASADAFGIANTLPNNVYALVAGGILGAVIVPQIVRSALHDDGGQRFVNKLLTLGLVVFLGITVLATVAAPVLVAIYTQQASDGGNGFTSEGLALATAFAYWCLPQILFYAVYSLLGEVLNARHVFGPFAWAPVINNLVAIAGLVAFTVLFGGAEANSSLEVWTPDRIALLAGSATLGIVAQAGVLAFFWRRTGLRFRPDFRWRGVGLGRTGKSAGWVFAMILVTQLSAIVQSQVTSLATDEGASIATSQNAWLIFILPHSVVAVSIATAFYTRMSTHASRGDIPAVRSDLSSAIRTIGLIITFASAGLIVLALPFARVFESDFGHVQAMAAVIIAYLVGLIPFSAVFVMQRAFYSLEDTRTVFFIELVKSALFVLGFLICTTLPVDLIAVGIALVTSVAITCQTVLTFLLLRRKIGPLGGRAILRSHVQFVVAAIISACIGAGLLALLGGLHDGGFAVGSMPGALVSMVVIGCVMGAAYAGLLTLMRNAELRALLAVVLRRIRPGAAE